MAFGTFGAAELVLLAIMALFGGMAGPGFIVKLMLLVAFGWSL